MAFKPIKRKAEFAKRSAKSKKARTNKYATLIPMVVNTLTHDEAVPANLRALFKNALPVVLNTNKADRHAYEAEVVDQALQSLGAVQAALQEKHATALATQNKVIDPSEEASRVAAKKQAEANLEAVKAKQESDKNTNKAAEKAEEEAAEVVKAAQKEEKAAEKDLQKAVDKQTSLANSLSGEFAMLKEGKAPTALTAEEKKAVQKIQAIGKEYGLDSTLLHSLPIAAKKNAENRSEFETMMFANLQALIEKQIGVLAQVVAEKEPVKAAKSAAVASAKEAHANAEAALTAAGATLDATHAAHKEANSEVAKASTHLRRIFHDMKAVCDAQDKLAGELRYLKDNVWGAFNQLKEKEPEPEPVEEPEPVAEAAAEEAPAEAAAW